jgi:hypothetical protein
MQDSNSFYLPFNRTNFLMIMWYEPQMSKVSETRSECSGHRRLHLKNKQLVIGKFLFRYRFRPKISVQKNETKTEIFVNLSDHLLQWFLSFFESSDT